ncbi:MAG: serine hydrolase domain-containing protein [Anaerolineae bacterium]|jgi:CubicO group peptidase (beta-lactamase class C family)
MHALQELDAYFRDRSARDEFAGVVLVTQGHEQRFAGAYGYASRAWRIPNTLDTRFDTASVTKLFTAIATLQLVDRGLFGVDTRAVDFLGLAGTAISPDATVYHLLTHTSGIGDDSEEEDGEVYEDLWKTRSNYAVVETADFLPQFVHKPANFPPGAGCRYCNCSFILLGLMIERATGQSYRDYVREHVFAPAGMTRSDFFRLDRFHEEVAEGADPIRDGHGRIVGWKKNIYSFPPIGSPDSGAHVTAGDLDRFLRAVQAGRLLSSERTADFLTPHAFYRQTDEWRILYGYGLSFYFDRSDRLIFYQKGGINAGVSAMLRHYPADDVTVVLLSNMEDGAWDPVWQVHEAIMARSSEGQGRGS